MNTHEITPNSNESTTKDTSPILINYRNDIHRNVATIGPEGHRYGVKVGSLVCNLATRRIEAVTDLNLPNVLRFAGQYLVLANQQLSAIGVEMKFHVFRLFWRGHPDSEQKLQESDLPQTIKDLILELITNNQLPIRGYLVFPDKNLVIDYLEPTLEVCQYNFNNLQVEPDESPATPMTNDESFITTDCNTHETTPPNKPDSENLNQEWLKFWNELYVDRNPDKLKRFHQNHSRESLPFPADVLSRARTAWEELRKPGARLVINLDQAALGDAMLIVVMWCSLLKALPKLQLILITKNPFFRLIKHRQIKCVSTPEEAQKETLLQKVQRKIATALGQQSPSTLTGDTVGEYDRYAKISQYNDAPYLIQIWSHHYAWYIHKILFKTYGFMKSNYTWRDWFDYVHQYHLQIPAQIDNIHVPIDPAKLPITKGRKVTIVYDSKIEDKLLPPAQLIQIAQEIHKITGDWPAIVVGRDTPEIALAVKHFVPEVELVEGNILEVLSYLISSKVVIHTDTGLGHLLDVLKSKMQQESNEVPKTVLLAGRLFSHNFWRPQTINAVLGAFSENEPIRQGSIDPKSIAQKVNELLQN